MLFRKYLFIEGLQYAGHQKKGYIKVIFRKHVLKANSKTNWNHIHFGGFKVKQTCIGNNNFS